ncbi:efflux RND transporter periplasmic adaptor subunit [Brevibacillus massiliensis]|uniref:efflux RND transporter periplasmic adaptor subunit n=1 Tax=Brevibacillus massiliensis TaxID=1118054 RepID=UPI000313C7F0|nr:efflux RND transporter periplasmic adaptor subunit [Brevibacillus massiliensis]
MNKKKWIIISAIAIVLAGGGVFGWKYLKSGEAVQEEPMGPPEMPTIAVDVGEVKKTIYATGTVEAKAREEVNPETSGKVKDVLVKEGQHVKKGDVLFTLDSDDAALELQKLELNLQRINKDLKEIKEKKDKIVADKAGRVKEVLVKEGDEVSKETIIAKLTNPNYLKITGNFTSYEVEHVKVGQKARVFLSGPMLYIDGTVTKVDLIGKKEDGFSGMHEIEVQVKKEGFMYANEKAVIELTGTDGLLFTSVGEAKFELPDDIEVTAGTSGKVAKVLIKEDDDVKENQTLVTMDVSAQEMELQEKELALKESLLSLEQKKRDLEKSQVTAPISGEVTKVNVKAGETKNSSEPAVVVMDTSAVYFKAHVDEIDFPAIQVGQTVDVYITAFGNQPFHGKVVELPKEGTKQDRSVRFEVKVELENNGKLSHGMTGDCDINISQKDNVPRLPVNAVEVMEEGKGTVMVKDPQTGEPVPKDVEIGIEGAEYVEIISGLSPGDEVIMMDGQF